MEKADKNLKDFVEGLELTILNNEDSILLDVLIGTRAPRTTLCPSANHCRSKCGSTIDNCHAGNCYAGCGVKP